MGAEAWQRVERCRQHYQSVYELSRTELSKGRTLDECLHHFFDQRLVGKHKNLSVADRAQGLAPAPLWFDVDAVEHPNSPAWPSVTRCIPIMQSVSSCCCTSLAHEGARRVAAEADLLLGLNLQANQKSIKVVFD